jgi:hypothetical protein
MGPDNTLGMGLSKQTQYDRASAKQKFAGVVYRDRPKGEAFVCSFCPFCGRGLMEGQ